MNVAFEAQPCNIDMFGLSIGRDDIKRKQQHIGLMYCSPINGQLLFLHLATNYTLTQETPHPYYFSMNLPLKEEEKKHFSMICHLIHRKNSDQIRYNIDFDNSFFCENGQFEPEHENSGLTCATFVIKVFESQKIFLVDTNAWPHRPEDIPWYKKMIHYFRKAQWFAEDYLAQLEYKIDYKLMRFRPEEVAAAAYIPGSPHSQQELNIFSQQILDALIEHRKQFK